MHLKRNKLTTKIPIARKGTSYVARARSNYKFGVPVVIAVRDILKLARTSKEVKYAVSKGLIKINGRKVKDINECVKLFNILEAEKKFVLTILPTGRFSLKETKDNFKTCKIIGKKIMKNKKVQFNLHDGTNLVSNEKLNIGDSLEFGFDSKIKKIVHLNKGAKAFVISGRNIGLEGKVEEVKDNKVILKLNEDERKVELDKSHIIAI